MTAGRPTDYSPAVLKQAEAYLATCNDEEVEHGSEDRPVYKTHVKLPSIEGLSRHLRVNRDTLYEWAKQHKEFSDILDDLRAEQGEKLINNGLSGDYNSTITKLMLTKHGYREASDITSDDKPIGGLTPEDRAALAKLHDVLKQ